MASSSGCASMLVMLLLCLLPLITLSVETEQFCILGKHHKAAPGPEDLSSTKCAAWSSQSCCSKETAELINANATDGTWLNFQWDHCGKLSEKCRAHFVEDLCFYECSPNAGPWITDEVPQRKIRQNRFREVPLCQSDCDAWFNDCQDDFTCTDNWAQNFNWSGGSNKCKTDSICRPFKVVFQSSKQFCENVFDHSFKYTADSQPCMKMSFNGSQENPNHIVEKWQIKMQNDLKNYHNTGASFLKTLPVFLISVLSMSFFFIESLLN